MSHAATNWAIQRRGLKPIAKILLWHLADCHNPVAGCFPTQEYLAEQAEISRASVNRHLDDLEAAGLIRREQSIDPSSKRQRPTRYLLAFEEGFQPLDVVGRVSGSDTEAVSQKDDSRVSEMAEAVSQSYETPTSNRTSKEPQDVGAHGFEDLLEEFPRRPGSVPATGIAAFERLTEAERPLAAKAVRHYSAWFREDCEARGEEIEERVRYVPFIANWLDSGDWRKAFMLPIKASSSEPSPDLVALAPDDPAFQAVQRARGGRPIFVGKYGKATFTKAEVDAARVAQGLAA